MCVWQNLQQQLCYKATVIISCHCSCLFLATGLSTTIYGRGVLHNNTTSLHYGTSVGGLSYMLVDQCTAGKAGEIFCVVKNTTQAFHFVL